MGVNKGDIRDGKRPSAKEKEVGGDGRRGKWRPIWSMYIACLVIAIAGTCLFCCSRMERVSKRKILPQAVKPLHYDLFLETRLSELKFDGSVGIAIRFLKDTKEICLNSKNLTIHNVTVITAENKVYSPVHIVVDDAQETLGMLFDKEFGKDEEARLVIYYSGALLNDLVGYYFSKYVDNGVVKYMASTQFEATDARKAFPCWDEPNIKATFSVTLKVPKDLTALSNMNEIKTVVDGDWKVVHFAKSPVMSTYLVAFVVGDLEYVEGKTSTRTPIPVRIYSPKGSGNRGEFALEVCTKTLGFFTEYLDIPYPLPKMDLVAIPDFASGAMENWGLVTFRMTLLLYDKKDSTIRAKMAVTEVIAHELAHQWFGNLVTMDWWSELWLNEGFATWMGWHATDHLFPEWNVWGDFYLTDTKSGLGLDSLLSSHPIEVDTPDPAQIRQVFDSISYSKGAALIRMLVAYLGQEDFRKGLILYLKTHQYKNARTEDLWLALGKVSGKPVKTMMEGWTKEVGYPLVIVKEQESKLDISQRRFLVSGSNKTGSHVWQIPMNVGVHGTSSKLEWTLNKIQGTFEMGKDRVYNLNMNQTGFYRVLYPSEHVSKLLSNVERDGINSIECVGILYDMFVYGIAGYSSSTSSMDWWKFFKGKTEDYYVWSEIDSQIHAIQHILYEDSGEVQASLRQMNVWLFGDMKKRYGWEVEKSEADLKTLMRALVLSVLGRNGHEQTAEEARTRFMRFIDGDETAINPNFKRLVFSSVVGNGDVAEFDQVFGIYEKSEVPDQKLVALTALTSTKNPELIQKMLDYTLEDGPVRGQDSVYVFQGFSNNLDAKKMLWPYVKKNWNRYYDRFREGGHLLKRIVECSVGCLVQEKELGDVRTFFANVEIEEISRAVEESLEKMEIRVNWLTRDGTAIREWISQWSPENQAVGG